MAFLTIRETIDAGTEVRAYCSDCHHHEALPLEDLGERLGFDFPVSHDSLVPILRCSKCQSKNITIRLNIVYSRGVKFDTKGQRME
jgi:hypothetical protein